MFTGLVEATGTIVSITPAPHADGPTRLVISSPAMAPRLRTGDSIAVSGVCLTALDITLTQFAADLAEETVRRTKLTRLEPGSVVNLELPTPSGAPMGGHVVQGHVDGVGTLLELEPVDPSDEAHSDWRLRLHIPSELTRYVAAQGSITVDGISLTVAKIVGDVVSIAIIPHTYGATAIHTLLPGSPLNIEVDILAKYAEKQSASRPLPRWTLTEDYILANGY
jgi:riboflavin synthase